MAQFNLARLMAPQTALLRELARLTPRGAAPVLVGGTVRNVLLGRRTGVDLDVAVAGGALSIARRLADTLGGAFVPLDAERGAARVVAPGHRIDLADFRAPTLAADLAARDFTVNALAVPLGELLRRGRAPIVDPRG